jgi:hypothetical protein
VGVEVDVDETGAGDDGVIDLVEDDGPVDGLLDGRRGPEPLVHPATGSSPRPSQPRNLRRSIMVI